MLTTSCGMKPGTQRPYNALWELTEGGFQMHNYLKHNDCREVVLTRIAKGEDEKEKDRQRKADARLAKLNKRIALASGGSPVGNPAENPGHVPDTARNSGTCPEARPAENPEIREKSGSIQNTEYRTLSADLPQSESEPLDFDLAAKGFLGWFREQYQIHMHAPYLVPPKQDAPLVRGMLRIVSMSRLEQLTSLLFVENIDDDWIRGSDRGISILKTKLNWLNQRLGAFEAKRQAARG